MNVTPARYRTIDKVEQKINARNSSDDSGCHERIVFPIFLKVFFQFGLDTFYGDFTDCILCFFFQHINKNSKLYVVYSCFHL